MSRPCWASAMAESGAGGRRNVLDGEGGLPDRQREKPRPPQPTCTRGAVTWEAQAVGTGAESLARALGAEH